MGRLDMFSKHCWGMSVVVRPQAYIDGREGQDGSRQKERAAIPIGCFANCGAVVASAVLARVVTPRGDP